MSRFQHRSVHARLAPILSAATLVFSSGCDLPFPLEDALVGIDISGDDDDSGLELAALTSSPEGYIEIVVLNLAGETTASIETTHLLSEVGESGSKQSLMHHSEDFFLVTTVTGDWQSLILRVDWDGTVSEFAQPNVSPMYRIDESRDGQIIVAAEYDIIKLDLNGVEVARDHNSNVCWTDVVASPNVFNGPIATDVMGITEVGPILAEWTIDESVPTTDSSTTGAATAAIGQNILRDEILGQDDEGGLWMAGRSGILQRSFGGISEEIGSIDELFGAFMTRAVESAGAESVYVLVDGGPASQVGRVNVEGASEVLFDYSGRLLLDMVLLP